MRCDDPNLQDFMRRHPPNKGRTLLIGSRVYEENSDRRQFYKNCVGLDMTAGDSVDIVHDLERPLPDRVGQFDHIDCCSVMEHVQRPWLMAENMEKALKPGGTLLLSVPFVWRVHGYPSDYWRMTQNTLPVIFKNIEWLDVVYMAQGKRHKKAQALDNKHRSWLERTELFGFGVRR